MDAERLLPRMCRRRGLPASRASELLPLVQRAVISSSRVRQRLLTLIDRNLARRSGGDPSATLESLEAELDDEVLVSVARRVHAWSPPWKPRDADSGGYPNGGGNSGSGQDGFDLGEGDLPGGLGGTL